MGPPRSSLQSILDKSLSELVQPFLESQYGISEIVRTSTGSCIFCPGFQVVSFHGKAIKTSEGTQVTKSGEFYQLKSLQFGLLYQTQHQTFFLNCFRAEVSPLTMCCLNIGGNLTIDNWLTYGSLTQVSLIKFNEALICD